MNNPGDFLDSFKRYDSKNLDLNTFQKVVYIINSSKLSSPRVAKVSRACQSIIEWVISVICLVGQAKLVSETVSQYESDLRHFTA